MGYSIRKLKTAILVVAPAFVAFASATGPEAEYTGAPGDIGNCSVCHDSFGYADVGPGIASVDAVPAVYEPGKEYTLRAGVEQSDRSRFGFQLTAIDSHGNRAGTLTPISPETQLSPQTGTGDRQYIQHTQAGTLAGTGGRIWELEWIAPPNDQGPVKFYMSGSAANGDGTNRNDYIYTAVSLSESPSSVVNLTFNSRLGGLTLAPGSKMTFSWTASNVLSVESYDIRYSVDGGKTFPIGQLIAASTNPMLSSYEWTIPDRPSSQVRIRVQAATISGVAVEVLSEQFAISGSVAGPRIANAVLDNKTLFITGDGFQDGAVVEIAGQPTRTANMSDFSRKLKRKKAANRIPSGSTVMLVVVNPDGLRSEAKAFILL